MSSGFKRDPHRRAAREAPLERGGSGGNPTLLEHFTAYDVDEAQVAVPVADVDADGNAAIVGHGQSPPSRTSMRSTELAHFIVGPTGPIAQFRSLAFSSHL